MKRPKQRMKCYKKQLRRWAKWGKKNEDRIQSILRSMGSADRSSTDLRQRCPVANYRNETGSHSAKDLDSRSEYHVVQG